MGEAAPARVVVYDGDCGVCSRVVDRMARVDRAGVLCFVPSSSLVELPPGVDRELLARTIVVVDPKTGKLWTRVDAFVEILRRVSRLSAAINFLTFPVVRTVANFAYDQFARRRARVSAALGLRACKRTPQAD